jgi:hypothetical protein
MMKSVLVLRSEALLRRVALASVCKVILAVFLSALIFLPFGCSSEQLGETTAEGNRRHLRNLRINQQELMEDADESLLLDQPSRLSDKRMP